MRTPVDTAAFTSLVAACVLLLGASAPVGAADPGTAGGPGARSLDAGYRAARAGKWPAAQTAFAAALRTDLRNPHLQFLNGLAHWQLGRREDAAHLSYGKVGFQTAVQQAPGDFWANLYLGYQCLEDAAYLEAQDAFARAARARPDRWEAAYGLGVASFLLGDALTTRLAAEEAARLDATRPETQRLRLLAAAAAGDGDVDELAARFTAQFPLDRAAPRRAAEILRTSMQPANDPESGGEDDAGAGATNQITIDVAIILSSVLNEKSRGVNLFDGLTLQFGYGNTYTATRNSGGNWSSSRSITQSIGVPQLDYSLNLFNDAGHYYHVLARPSLTAHLGKESEFFAGRTINVSVSGVNLGSLQPIDVGVGLKVEPESIEGDRVRFRTNVSRSFLSREEAGTFSESLTTFKQLVSATAEVKFGQTLVLSALSETIDDNTFSKTPGLGGVPVMSSFFRQSTDMHRQETLLVLITPAPVTSFGSEMMPTPAALAALIDTWKSQIDPQSNLASIVERLKHGIRAPRGHRGDLGWNTVLSPTLTAEALRENAESAGY